MPVRSVRVHPLVLYVIVDAYERRNADQEHVVGTLLGTESEKHAVVITNCFTTPHQENDQEVRSVGVLSKFTSRIGKHLGW